MKKSIKSRLTLEILHLDLNEINAKQQFLQSYLQNIPFYMAVSLFENNDHKCYNLFIECALRGNAYALFYIKHLKDHYPNEFSNNEDNIVVNHLDFWLKNVPTLRTVHPSDYLKTSLIKMEIQQAQKNHILLSKERQKEILDYLQNKIFTCTAACILLQDIIDDKYSQACKIIEDKKQKIKSSLCEDGFQIVDLFLIAHLAPTNSKVLAYIDKIYELLNKEDHSKYYFNGVLERMMSKLSNKYHWQTAGAFMGNGSLYYMNSKHAIESLENRIKSVFFAALSGDLYVKAKLGMYFYSVDQKYIHSKSNWFKFDLPINRDTQSLGNHFLLSFANMKIASLRKMLEEEWAEYKNETINWQYWGDVYATCGKLIEGPAFEDKYNEKSFNCYVKSAVFESVIGIYNLAFYYEKNILNNDPKNIDKAISLYKKSLSLGDDFSLNRLIIIYYQLEEYEQAAFFLQELFNKNIDIAKQDEELPFISAKMLINGLGGIAIDKSRAYNIIINSAMNYNNIHSGFEIIRDFIEAKTFSSRLKLDQLSKLAIKLYNQLNTKAINYNQSNASTFLILFFASPLFLNAEMANSLITQGLSEQNLYVIKLMVHYLLHGQASLGIKENAAEAIKYCDILLQMDLDLNEKYEIFNVKGIAFMKGLPDEEALLNAESMLLEAYQHKITFSAYNLGCLYLKMNNLEKSYTYLNEAYKQTPNDPDVLCDLGMCSLKLNNFNDEASIVFIKECFNQAIAQGNNRCILDLTLLHLNEAFSNDKNINQSLLINIFDSFLNYVSSSELMDKHSDQSKNDIYLLDAIINLIIKPFLLTKIINNFEKLATRSYRLEFALKYLKNKPQGRDINELGFDLYLIMISAECNTIEELEDKFRRNGLILYYNQTVKVNPVKTTINDKEEINLQIKIDRFKKRLINFIDPNGSKSSVSFKELEKLSVKSPCFFPNKIKQSIVKHAAGGGSCKTIEIQPENNSSIITFVYHPVHRKNRSNNELLDPKRRSAARDMAKELQEIIERQPIAGLSHSK